MKHTVFKSDLLHTLHERGYVHQLSHPEALDQKLSEGKPITGYIGFDATADSLHVGSLVQIMLLYRLQQHGHRPIALLGGGTTLLGDPSGKDEQRQLLSREKINQNAEGIRLVLQRFLRFGTQAGDALMLNNADWLCDLNLMEFLRDYGRLFSVNRMLSFDSVRLRLEREQPLSFLEFNYMIMQAYDFMSLYRQEGCVLQMGGSDQWGNIINGIELIRRTENAEAFAITTPLLTTSSGAKMGKSASGAAWLSAEKLPVYDFWQYWRNTEDADVGRFLKLFTDIPMDEIARLEKLEGAEINVAKTVLANAVTVLCHGAKAAEAAEKTAQQTFADGGMGAELPCLCHADSVWQEGQGIIDVLRALDFVKSGGEARNKIADGAVKLGKTTITEHTFRVSSIEFADSAELRLSLGKKKHAILKRT